MILQAYVVVLAALIALTRWSFPAPAPAARRGHPRFLAHVEAAVGRARGPVYDARLPLEFAVSSTRVAVPSDTTLELEGSAA